MPTTQLLLLTVLLLPGLAYLMVRERNTSERRPSAFREASSVVFGSVIAELTVLGMFAIVRSLWPQHTPDVGQLMRSGNKYAETHYASLMSWAVGLLLGAVLLAGLAAQWSKGRQHTSTMSAWWVLFEHWHADSDVYVGCVLNDGSFIEGRKASFNTSAQDSPERDLILVGPIRYRPPNATEAQPYPAGAVCISASKLTAMFVSYPPAAGAAAGVVVPPAAGAGQASAGAPA